jgi:hypothetical protein
VGDSPFLSIGVTKEDTSGLVLDRIQGVSLVDLLGEEVRLGEHDTSCRRVVGQICCTAKTLSLDDGAVVLEEALVVSQVIRENVEVVANEWKSFGASLMERPSIVISMGPLEAVMSWSVLRAP